MCHVLASLIGVSGACRPATAQLWQGDEEASFAAAYLSNQRFALEIWAEGNGTLLTVPGYLNVTLAPLNSTHLTLNVLLASAALSFPVARASFPGMVHLSFNRFFWAVTTQAGQIARVDTQIPVIPIPSGTITRVPGAFMVAASSSPLPVLLACGRNLTMHVVAPSNVSLDPDPNLVPFRTQLIVVEADPLALCDSLHPLNLTRTITSLDTRYPLTTLTVTSCSPIAYDATRLYQTRIRAAHQCIEGQFYPLAEARTLPFIALPIKGLYGNVTSVQRVYPYEVCYEWFAPVLVSNESVSYGNMVWSLQLSPYPGVTNATVIGSYTFPTTTGVRYRVTRVIGDVTDAYGIFIAANQLLLGGMKVYASSPAAVYYRAETCTAFPETFDDDVGAVEFRAGANQTRVVARASNPDIMPLAFTIGDYLDIIAGSQSEAYELRVGVSRGILISPYCAEGTRCQSFEATGVVAQLADVLRVSNVSLDGVVVLVNTDGLRAELNGSYAYLIFQETNTMRRRTLVERVNQSTLHILITGSTFSGLLLLVVVAFGVYLLVTGGRPARIVVKKKKKDAPVPVARPPAAHSAPAAAASVRSVHKRNPYFSAAI